MYCARRLMSSENDKKLMPPGGIFLERL